MSDHQCQGRIEFFDDEDQNAHCFHATGKTKERYREEVCCFCGDLFLGPEEPTKHGEYVPGFKGLDVTDSPGFAAFQGVKERTSKEVKAFIRARKNTQKTTKKEKP